MQIPKCFEYANISDAPCTSHCLEWSQSCDFQWSTRGSRLGSRGVRPCCCVYVTCANLPLYFEFLQNFYKVYKTWPVLSKHKIRSFPEQDHVHLLILPVVGHDVLRLVNLAVLWEIVHVRLIFPNLIKPKQMKVLPEHPASSSSSRACRGRFRVRTR